MGFTDRKKMAAQGRRQRAMEQITITKREDVQREATFVQQPRPPSKRALTRHEWGKKKQCERCHGHYWTKVQDPECPHRPTSTAFSLYYRGPV